MIAPIRQQEPPRQQDRPTISPGLLAARRLVANVLFRGADGERKAPAVASWRAWLWVVWVGVVIAVYGGRMLGWF